MKTKPILIIPAIIVFAGLLFLVRCKTAKQKAESSEVTQFLNKFNNGINEGNADTVMACFETDQKQTISRFVNLLCGKTGKDGLKPLAGIKLDVDNADIKTGADGLITASIPASFNHDSLTSQKSILILKISVVAPHQLKILQADARRFLTDYYAYENYVRVKTVPDKDIYSPVTLAAFKTAGQLKTRYDSVIWFAHIDGKTYFYVVRGKWNIDNDISRRTDTTVDTYKMGLVNPGLKEIIPAQYDLVHNIGATFPQWVEVEKDSKKGFYNLAGKMVVPVVYDQVFPIDDPGNLAVLRAGNDYFYLKNDSTISEKVDLKINDFFPKIKNLTDSYDLYKNALKVVTEYNSRTEHGAIYIAPSYLADLNMTNKWQNFKNPLRKLESDEDVHKNYEVKYSGVEKTSDNWLEASFYSIRDYFLGGRSEFYDKKNIVIVDKKFNRIFTRQIETDYSAEEGGGPLNEICNTNSIKAINDSLFEIKSGASLDYELYDSTKVILGGSYYHYMAVKDNKLVELPDNRLFGFTKYIKLDDSYLAGCYNLLIGTGMYDTRKSQTVDHITPEMLRYMKNEIYADYRYKFKDRRWQEVFTYSRFSYSENKRQNDNVGDSLTVIDKYNIEWINSKLNKPKANNLAAR